LNPGHLIVIDLGKTLSKVSLWSHDGRMLDRQVRPNAPGSVDDILRLDVDGVGEWVLDQLARHAGQPIAAIIPVGHGAGIVAVRDGAVAIAPFDYEQAIPDDVMADYRAARDPFTITGSPALPYGLNLGAQLYWMERRYPDAMAGATLIPWAQYWAWLLTGRAVSEVTSLGCHSDLWAPSELVFSSFW